MVGVVYRTTIPARVQIARRATDSDLDSDTATQPNQNGRFGFAPLATIRADNESAGKQVTVFADKVRQCRATDLFLALKKELHIQRQRAFGLEQCLNRQDRWQ